MFMFILVLSKILQLIHEVNVGMHLNSSEKVPMHAGHLLTAFPSLSAPTYPLTYKYIV